MKLKRIMEILKNPAKWRTLYKSITILFINILHYRNFSINPNIKKYWDRMFLNTKIFLRNEHYHYLLDIFPRDEEFSLLDIGCATGSGCELIKEKFPKARITGIDISTTGIGFAKQKSKDIEYLVLDILKDPLPGTYDWIIIVQTLEHFDDPFRVVDKCLKHVKKTLIVTVPFRQTLMSSHKILNRGWHRYVFNENTFKNYNSRVVQITGFIESTNAQCIIYEIKQ